MQAAQLDMVRRRTEREEQDRLSPLAALSVQSKGRRQPEEPSAIRTEFARDRDRILHSKAFRRLKYKTQVFFAPSGDHYRTRLTHTLEVAQIARTISRALRLNEDLTEAIALGHDVGHAPFGHAGEQALDAVCPGGFIHSEQSLRVLDVLERDGEGLNLTWEVRDGIAYHSKHQESVSQPLLHSTGTLEGTVVRFCDAIAYLNADIDDAVRAGLIALHDLPERATACLGQTHGERIGTMVTGVVAQSWGIAEGDPSSSISMPPDLLEATDELRAFMFDRVYRHPDVNREADKARTVVTQLYERFAAGSEEYRQYMDADDPSSVWTLCDFISGMTDRYATALFTRLFTPQPWAY
ncbi:MAG: deoxyguanosinetriphosphate triphosphohydrolase [Chloroflexota bacterium]|nr:deoxyguanosinetriphosphate triphosphohydrolase [Chloroflexota bacterium]